MLLVSLAALVVPAPRRREFLDQWRAELWHYAQWLERTGISHARLRLLARASGAAPHAVQLRILQWSPRMIGQDLKFAWRLFVRRPGFTGVAVLILALGIGANTTIFSWTQALLLSPLSGVPRQDRLLVLNGVTPDRDNLSFSYPNFQDLRAAKPDGVADLIAFRVLPMNLRAGDEPMRVFGELVSPNFFEVLGVRPALGRPYRGDEGVVPGKDAVAVISDALWRRVFGGDPSVIGRSVTLNARPFTIIGVAPPQFHGSAAAVALDVYALITMQTTFRGGDLLAQRGSNWLEVYARLADGAPPRAVQASVRVAAARLAQQYPDANRGRDIRAVPLWRSGASNVLLPVLGTLVGLVALVLLIACANVAGLLLARATGREREIGVRLAVGASRWQIIRQMLLENLLLSAAGCVGGLLIARWAAGLLNAFVPRTPFPLRLDASVDANGIVFASALTVVAAVLSGVVPALRASRPQVSITLKGASPTGTVQTGRLRQLLVAGQVGLSMVLLVCAALFTRSLTHAGSMDPGFSLRQGFLASIDLLPGGYDEARGAVFLQRLLERVAALPHVTAATVARTMPLDLGGSSDMTVTVDGYTPRQGEEVMAYYNQVGPAYFETMGIPLVRGRAIAASDTRGQAAVAIVNETMARRYWAGRDPIGTTIRFGRGPVTIVGVARDGKYSQLTEKPRNYLYLPALQSYRPDLVLHVKTDTDPALVLPAVRGAVHDLDPNLPMFDVRTIEQHMRISTFIGRMAAATLASFGVLGLLLAAVGLYGVVAFNAVQRTREIGLRVALGADPRQVVGLILRDAMGVVGAGLGAGLALSFAAGRLVASQLIGVSAADPISFGATAALLALVAAAACALPAWRAAKLSPLVALRGE